MPCLLRFHKKGNIASIAMSFRVGHCHADISRRWSHVKLIWINIYINITVTHVPPERVRESHWERYRNSPQSSSRRTFPGNEDILFCLEQRWLAPFRLHDLRMLETCQKTTGHQECWISTRREATPQEHCRYLEWLRIMRWWQPECVKMTDEWT